jgi:hypothetical protein
MTTRGDIIIRNPSNVTARLGRGSAGTVLSSDGTDVSWQAASGAGLVLLESHAASASASLDFVTRNAPGQSGNTFQSDFDEYIFDLLDLVPATNGTQLWMRVHVASAFISASKYQTAGWAWIFNAQAAFGNSVGGLAAQMSTSNANDTLNTSTGLSGTVHVFNPAATTTDRRISGEFGWVESGAGNMKGSSVRASYHDTTGANGFQFLFSSGNITSGTGRVYGVSK